MIDGGFRLRFLLDLLLHSAPVGEGVVHGASGNKLEFGLVFEVAAGEVQGRRDALTESGAVRTNWAAG